MSGYLRVAEVPAADAERVLWIRLASRSDLDRLAHEAQALAACERPFGMVLTVAGLRLDAHRGSFPSIRRMPGGRARFGTWCRGVAYVFGPGSAIDGARRHVREAPLIWGTLINVSHSTSVAASWMEAQFRRYVESVPVS